MRLQPKNNSGFLEIYFLLIDDKDAWDGYHGDYGKQPSTRAMFTANPDTEDKTKWVPSKNGVYSVKSA
ncbi:hypothetical protein RHMOL_Rhmol04G0226400 [Rhododendron molle]|uniref:Uncharacterized protein n=1 Tax=Rhododendron molle TaxID=49168 RepID=A0ACC0P5S9_RHOML|nr:hypothetical protein RHMOL_Rhmol04G0226400 [Rhododendron molle]